MSMINIVITGKPGSGKGTVSKQLVKRFDIKHLATGDMLRRHVSNKTDIGVSIKYFIDRGMFAPDDVVNEMVKNEVDLAESEGYDGVILDGFPRNVAQADFLAKSKIAIDCVINLWCDDETVVDRILKRAHIEKRADDQDESVVRARLQKYVMDTEPVLQYYDIAGVPVHYVESTHSAHTLREIVNIIQSSLPHNETLKPNFASFTRGLG